MSEQDTGHPNRKEPRLPFRSKVKVRCDNWDRVVSLYTQNISRGGMFLKTENPPAIGSELTVALLLPDGRALDLAATVAHVVSPERAKMDKRTAGMGIFFTPLSDAQREIVEEILEQVRGSGPPGDDNPSAPRGVPAIKESSKPTVEAIPEPQDDEVSGAYDKIDALDDEAAKLLVALEAELGRLRECRPWEVLGVAPDASDDDIAAAYRMLCKRYHPDVFAQWHAQEVRSVASDCFIMIKKANERLQALRRVQPKRPTPPRPVAQPAPVTPRAPRPQSVPMAAAGPRPEATPQPVRRVAEPVVVARAPQQTTRPAHSFSVPQSLAPGARPQAAPGAPPRPKTVFPRMAERAPEPEEDFTPVPTQLTARDLFDDSQPLPVQPPSAAIEADAGAARRVGASRPAAEEGLDLFQKKRYVEARTKLAEALRRDPRNRVLRVTYHLSVGMDLKEQGRHDDARKQFESVLVLDPENAEAIAALRSQSSEKQAAKRSFLDGIFGKK